EERQALPYPNPASDQVRWPLEPGNTVRSVTAVGMDGRRIPLRWNGEVIELGELPPGTYVLERGHAGGMLERSRLSVLL
ncbi:MAG: T9SS type A sorting domain-containing protein, partial [Flavobacteriales bacterium]|nr:T9SS type A sorting domain-containing protein [Flavobacteriales bacterium]